MYGRLMENETADAAFRKAEKDRKMKDLAKYENMLVRALCREGSVFTGPAQWFPQEFMRDEFGEDEEALKIGDTYVYGSLIERIEVLRREVCIPVRDWPEAKDEIALWFAGRWSVPLKAYRESIGECLRHEDGVPQWYVVVRGGKIIGGCGVIENDFHERKDLAPNVCAVYVDEGYRNEGIAGFMLDFVCGDMARLGYRTLYLLTDHVGFYERYGWEYLCPVRGDDGVLSRMYVRRE